MMASGGQRTPSNPAVVSGPGRLSQRTDGGVGSRQVASYVAGGDYGDGGLMGLQQGAPMSATPSIASNPTSAQPQVDNSQPLVPLTAPSQRPNEPVTEGAAAGPGNGPEVLGLPAPTQQGGGSAKQIVQGLASRPDASPELRRLADILGK